MADENKRNILYFESCTMRELYQAMEDWQAQNQKRFLSISIQHDHDMFCCIALSNPVEVVISDYSGEQVYVYGHALAVTAG